MQVEIALELIRAGDCLAKWSTEITILARDRSLSVATTSNLKGGATFSQTYLDESCVTLFVVRGASVSETWVLPV